MNPQPKFIVDLMLGRLARWLRILGYDAEYIEENQKSEIIYRSLKENRILVSRNKHLSSRTPLRRVMIKSEKINLQIKQIIQELNLKIKEKAIFSRCSECNVPVKAVKKEGVKGKVPPYVFKTQKDFSICPKCGKIFWMGTHWKLLKKNLKKLDEVH